MVEALVGLPFFAAGVTLIEAAFPFPLLPPSVYSVASVGVVCDSALTASANRSILSCLATRELSSSLLL